MVLNYLGCSWQTSHETCIRLNQQLQTLRLGGRMFQERLERFLNLTHISAACQYNVQSRQASLINSPLSLALYESACNIIIMIQYYCRPYTSLCVEIIPGLSLSLFSFLHTNMFIRFCVLLFTSFLSYCRNAQHAVTFRAKYLFI